MEMSKFITNIANGNKAIKEEIRQFHEKNGLKFVKSIYIVVIKQES